MKVLAMVLLSTAIVLSVPTSTPAQVSKEGGISGLAPYSTTSLKSISMGQERSTHAYETVGVVIGDSPDSILHNASFRCVGAIHIVKGVVEDSGFCVYRRPDGDRIFSTTRANGPMGPGTKRVWTLVGGTGKFVSITGGGESTSASGIRPAIEGIAQNYTKMNGRYTLP
jgi:hypothetical protein